MKFVLLFLRAFTHSKSLWPKDKKRWLALFSFHFLSLSLECSSPHSRTVSLFSVGMIAQYKISLTHNVLSKENFLLCDDAYHVIYIYFVCFPILGAVVALYIHHQNCVTTKGWTFSQLKKAKYLSKWLKTSSSDQIWSSVYLTVSNKCCNFPGFMDSFWDQLWKEKLRWEQARMKRNPWLWPMQYKIRYKILQTLQRL